MVKPEKFGHLHLVYQFTVRLSVYLHNLQGKICVMNLIHNCTGYNIYLCVCVDFWYLQGQI